MTIKFAIDINLPGFLPFLQHFESQIMSKLDELTTSTDALLAKVEESNAKTDQLIVVANTTKDALAALQGQLAGGTAVTDADLQAIIDKQATAIASLTVQEGETDAAATAVAP